MIIFSAPYLFGMTKKIYVKLFIYLSEKLEKTSCFLASSTAFENITVPMNTKVSVVRSYKSKDNLVILADYDDFSWTSKFLSQVEIAFLRKAAHREVSDVFFPQENRSLIVQFAHHNAPENEDRENARMAGCDILTTLSHYKLERVTLLNRSRVNRTAEYLEGMLLGNYQFLKYFKDKVSKANPLQHIQVDQESLPRKVLQELLAVVVSTCTARDLVNEPQSYLSATKLSEEIKSSGKKAGFSVKVLDKKKIQQLKMGGLLAVNLGSKHPPTFSILEWKPKKAKNKKPIVLVGKGVVYDTGGVSLKPTANSMDMMKSDMAGAATVIGTMMAISMAKLPIHLIALVPSTDNRPGHDAYVPGDVIKMHSGSTVEVLNTDAEGRLILADALHYAKKYKPELVMDFATLTGSAARAVGPEAICYMGKADRGIKSQMEASGHAVYERLIEFPLWKEYGEYLKSNIADLKNLGGASSGMITAGKFLEHFTDYPWLHFDIAGSAYLKASDSYRSKEGTGVGVRLLFDFLKKYPS